MKSLFLLLSLFSISGCYQKDDLENRVSKIQSMYLEYKKDFPEVRDIQAKELKKSYVFIDIRTDRERALSTIPGSISKEDFEANIEDYIDQDLVTFCTVGYRSGIYAQELMEEGHRVQNLVGGVLMWAHDGRKFIDSKGHPTKTVHVYGKNWDLLPEGFESEY